MPTSIDGLLAGLEYPGRLLAAGLDPAGRGVVVYMVTGRSASSQARKLVGSGPNIQVQPTDEEMLRTGDPDLLIYRALAIRRAGVAVSNGKQTDPIAEAIGQGAKPVDVLKKALAVWDYEPDQPIFTPRISACLTAEGLAMSVLRRATDGSTQRDYYQPRLGPGRAFFISTYAGPNRSPLPLFEGGPIEVGLPKSEPQALAELVYGALRPALPDRDLRVAAVCAIFDPASPSRARTAIINRHERI